MSLAMVLAGIDHAAGGGEGDERGTNGEDRGRQRGGTVQLHGECFLSAGCPLAIHAPFCPRVIGATACASRCARTNGSAARSIPDSVIARTRASHRCWFIHTRSCAVFTSGRILLPRYATRSMPQRSSYTSLRPAA